MPDIARIPLRMDCAGVDLAHPIDRMPPGTFPYMFNTRVIKEGVLSARPGYTKLADLAGSPNSIRRLNDPSLVHAATGYVNVGGVSTDLYAGVPTSYTKVASGFSGNPLSLITFRPDQSVESMMYVYDANENIKVLPDKTTKSIGVTPPNKAPAIEYGIPSDVDIAAGQSATGWSATGGSTGPTAVDRTASSSPTISSILYNTGNMGWCCINPVITNPSWMGDRMKVILNGTETVAVRNVLNAISNTTIEAIQYDAGLSGKCSLTLVGSPAGLDRNSLIQINSEVVRVLEVVPSPTGTEYGVRCSTTATHAAGAPVTGLISWYVYTLSTHVAGESITSNYLSAGQAALGVGAIQADISPDGLMTSNFRPIDPANDYMHISVYLQNPTNVTNIQVLLSLDTTPNFSFSNPGNSYIWTLTQAELKIQGSSDASWADVVVPISEAVRSGNDFSRTLANITGMAVQITCTGACTYGFDWFYFFGTYGQVIQPNSPVGVTYQERFRDSTTGAASVPGPLTRYQLFPLRESVIVTPVTSTIPLDGVDSIDIYRLGGSITSPLYVGTVTPPTTTLTDGLPDSTVLEIDQAPDLTAIQPWAVLQPAKSGIVNIVGTTVTYVSGNQFDLNLLGNTEITLEGVAYQLHGSPINPFSLQLTQSAGAGTNIYYIINSPTYAAQALPFAFGPLEGPFAPVIFALGDPVNGGLLYYSNFGSADTAADTNTLELDAPSHDLVSGAVWNGICFAGNRDRIFVVRYSYLSTLGVSNSANYQWNGVGAAPSGMWSRWACCSCPIGVAYLGRDGLYIVTDSSSANITDERLYPLFPHDGQPAKTVTIGTDIVLPVDMTQTQFLRLTYCDETLRFAYKDTDGNFVTLFYEIYKKRWFMNNYFDGINLHYLVEDAESGPDDQEILMLSMNTNKLVQAGGNTDDGNPINTVVTLPSFDGGDERIQKLYVDTMIQLEMGNSSGVNYVATYDDAQATSPVVVLQPNPGIYQLPVSLAALGSLTLYRNIGAKFDWTGGPDGASLYAWEVSGFPQPYLSNSFVIQFSPLSFPGWKHMRRAFPALISVGDVLMDIWTQDGRQFGPYTLPATLGTYRILPMMLDQNIKDLAFSIQLREINNESFAFFPSDFTIEVKEWTEESYIKLAVFKA
jgi:hypothetical protein